MSKSIRLAYILSFVIFLGGVLCYSSSLRNEFVWDDVHFIQNDPNIHSTRNIDQLLTKNVGYGGGSRNNFYRPVFSIINMINYMMGGGQPLAFRITSVLLHAACAVLIWLLFLRLSGNIWVSFSAGLLFALHPVQTQAVAYTAGRADSLYVLFGTLSIILFLKYIDRPGHRIPLALSVLSLSLALLSKETAIIIPFLTLLCVNRLKGPFRKDKSSYKKTFPLFALTAVYILLRFTVLDFSKTSYSGLSLETPSFLTRSLTACKALFMYLRFLIAPTGFQMETHLPASTSLADPAALMSLTALILIAFLMFRFRKKFKNAVFGISWFLISLAPVLNLFPVNAFIAIHWLYLPSAGFFFAVSSLIWFALRKTGPYRTRCFLLLLTVAAILLGGLTWRKNFEWKDQITLYESILRYSRTPRVYVNLGNIYVNRGDLDKARKYYLEALKIAPGQTEAHVNLAYIHNARKDYDKAEKRLETALDLSPRHPNAHFNLAVVYFNTGRTDQAVERIQRTIELNPNHIPALNILGRYYYRIGRRGKAASLFARSLRLSPGQPGIKRLYDLSSSGKISRREL